MTVKNTKDSSYVSLLNIVSDYTSVFYIKIKQIFKEIFLPHDIVLYINVSSPLFIYKLLEDRNLVSYFLPVYVDTV